MAAEVGSAPVNGYGHGTDAYRHQPTASATSSQAGYSAASAAAPVAASSAQQSDISKEQVAWYFVESYYTTMSQTPEKLHLFFNKRSQLVSGVEEEKSSVASGQKAIKERLSELDFQDCKVRVTNVDSQGSDNTIVIQVIGEMSNKSQPHRKFVQTFVLASQTNGYFVLNDIFRYIKDDVDDEEAAAGAEEAQQEVDEEPVAKETVHVEAAGTEEEVKEEVLKQVEQKLEELTTAEPEAEKEEAPAAAVNGTPVPKAAEVAEAEEAPAAAVSAPSDEKAEEVEAAVAQEDLEPEKPQDPAPTPKAAEPPVAAAPSAPPKPAVPRSWAQLAAGNQANKAAAAAAAAAPAARQAPTPASQPKPTAAPAAASASSAPAREASPDSNKEGSTGGWQTAGADHARKQSRAQNAPATGSDGRVRAFVKNVTEDVDADALKAVLAKFGDIVYFDVARQKKAAFVEYKTAAGFNAAVAASPHRVGSEDVWVEERRVAGSFSARGGARGGRGGYEGRGGAPRGGFGPRGGRGGSGNVTPRGGRGGAQA